MSPKEVIHALKIGLSESLELIEDIQSKEARKFSNLEVNHKVEQLEYLLKLTDYVEYPPQKHPLYDN